MSNPKKKGSKQEVYDGLALSTSGGLKKEDLILNSKGQVVSKKRSEQGKKQYPNLKKSRPEAALPEQPQPEPEKASLPEPASNPGSSISESKENKEEEDDELNFPIPTIEAKEEPKKKVRKYSNKKIKNENPVIDEIQHGDKFN